MDELTTILQKILDAIQIHQSVGGEDEFSPQTRYFVPARKLRERDMTLVDMLNSVGHEDISFCISDPSLPDCPIVFASDGFCKVTGYPSSEIQGKNCRFLQGKGTLSSDVDRIRNAIKREKEASVNLLNYKTPFNNEFYLTPLFSDSGANQKKVQYFAGIQCSVAKLGPGQAPKNVGWVYSQGLHV